MPDETQDNVPAAPEFEPHAFDRGDGPGFNEWLAQVGALINGTPDPDKFQEAYENGHAPRDAAHDFKEALNDTANS